MTTLGLTDILGPEPSGWTEKYFDFKKKNKVVEQIVILTSFTMHRGETENEIEDLQKLSFYFQITFSGLKRSAGRE